MSSCSGVPGKAKKNEHTPLLVKSSNKTSYGGQSASSHSNVEENYGETPTVETPTVKTDNPWHVEPETSDGESDDEESVDESEISSVPVPTARPVDEVDDAQPKTSKKGKKLAPKRNACHSFFILVQTSSCLANLVMMATQLVPVFVCKMELLNLIVRSYLAFFCFFFFLIEMELPFLSKQGSNNWIFRSFMYTFLGTITLEERTEMIADGALAKTKVPDQYWDEVWASFYIYISSWWMIVNGFVYFLLGLFCMRKVRDNCRKEFKAKMRKYKDTSNKG